MKTKEYIAARAAMELHDGDIVNLGIGLPTLVTSYLPKDINVILHSENGIVGTAAKPDAQSAEPFYVTDAGGETAAVALGGCFIDSSVSFGLIRGGHVDCTVLGALEVDERGNLANWIIPGKMVPGMGGAMDLTVGAKKMIVAMEHTARGRPKILEKCSLPLTAAGCVDLIITEMCVLQVTGEGLLMTEYNPAYSVDEIRAATQAKLLISPTLKQMPVGGADK